MPTLADLLAGLNTAQRQAVTAPIGPVLVRAGAGSGKTRVLTLRVAYLIAEHRAPMGSILALTFTNKAAREMRERLRGVLGKRLRGLTVGTFHAVCAGLLRAEIGGRIGSYTGDFSIYASSEQEQLAAEALDATRERAPVLLEPRALLGHISRAKSKLLTPRMALRFAQTPLDSFVAGCYRRYQETLRRANALDFDDLIMLTHRLLTEHPDVLDACQARWQHVLTDEFQDTDASQFALLELLSRPEGTQARSLFAVGDGMQAIYGFRNADYTIINRFAQDFPTAQVIELTTNYRSRQPILDAAYAVIRHSRAVPPMPLDAVTARLPGERSLFIQQARDARDEAEQLARQIGDLLLRGRRASEVALLFRTRHMSRAFEAALRHARISYRVRGGTGFYDRAVVRDMLAYLRVIANPADSLSLNRIANTPARGLGAQALATLATYAAQQGSTFAEALADPAAHQQLAGRARAGAQRLAALLARWQRQANGGYPPEHLLHDVLEQSGYLAALAEKLSPEDYRDAEAHLHELSAATQEHSNLRAFLQEVALLTNSDEDEPGEQVQLLTIHAAKGLEWPLVFVAGLEEGTLPHERSLGAAAGLEEERRLCYVALTRAAEQLYLSWTPGRQRGKTLQPSRFLGEIEAYGRERAQQAGRTH